MRAVPQGSSVGPEGKLGGKHQSAKTPLPETFSSFLLPLFLRAQSPCSPCLWLLLAQAHLLAAFQSAKCAFNSISLE